MEGALRRAWWVGGPFRTWESFFVLWEMNPSFCFINAGLQLMLGSTTVATAALLCPLLPYVLLHCRTAALLLFCFLVLTYRGYTAPICSFRHTGRQLANSGSTKASGRIGNASAFRLAPGLAGNSEQMQISPSPRAL